ncbi:hypothetical protein CDAR_501681 [Caerostris darwini]|uniref:Uncharacterized protein n=1 Tax=Caerostris darwini TaxID=1538125 RepID=A0AAV4TQC7_9ARAC|nr:hypothetical protein CDAR_501681 [Caerostris darwini]
MRHNKAIIRNIHSSKSTMISVQKRFGERDREPPLITSANKLNNPEQLVGPLEYVFHVLNRLLIRIWLPAEYYCNEYAGPHAFANELNICIDFQDSMSSCKIRIVMKYCCF